MASPCFETTMDETIQMEPPKDINY